MMMLSDFLFRHGICMVYTMVAKFKILELNYTSIQFLIKSNDTVFAFQPFNVSSSRHLPMAASVLHATKYTTVCVNSSVVQVTIWLDRAHGDVRVISNGVEHLYSARVSALLSSLFLFLFLFLFCFCFYFCFVIVLFLFCFCLFFLFCFLSLLLLLLFCCLLGSLVCRFQLFSNIQLIILELFQMHPPQSVSLLILLQSKFSTFYNKFDTLQSRYRETNN